MTISILVEGVERKSVIDYASFKKTDVLTSQVDDLSFVVKKVSASGWKPAVGEEIVVTVDGAKEFGGFIVGVQEKVAGRDLLIYEVTCKDYTHELDRQLVVETYSSTSVLHIIQDIATNYLTNFTLNNVNCDLVIDYIAFNYEQPSKCFQMLAELTGFEWYVDYDRDIHFFSKFSQAAPFNINDTLGNHIYESLFIDNDLTELRNTVYVRGGEYEADPRSEIYQIENSVVTVNLAYKYASKPAVVVNGTTVTVGIDGLDSFTDYDWLWNYNAKYIVTDVGSTATIQITGIPLFPVLALVYDEASILTYGIFMHRILDKSIGSKAAARERALAELTAYSQPLKHGRFETTQSGLRSGQLINAQSTVRDIASENFLINKVTMGMLGPDKLTWTVEISSVRPLGIIDFFQELVLAGNKDIEIDKDEILELVRSIQENLSMVESVAKQSGNAVTENIQVAESVRRNPFTPVWVWAPYVPINDADTKRALVWDGSYWG